MYFCKRNLLSLGLVFFLSMILSSCTKKKSEVIFSENIPEKIILDDHKIKANQLSFVKVGFSQVKPFLQTTGKLKANDNKVFKISSMISGRVLNDYVKLGDLVKTDQLLAQLDNPEFAKIQANYIHDLHLSEIEITRAKTKAELASSSLAREKKLFEQGISPQKDLLQAQADATIAQSDLDAALHHKEHVNSEAKQVLGSYGLRIENLNTSKISNSVNIAATHSGIVTQKNITTGSVVDPQAVLYEISDLSDLWLDINVYSQDISKVKMGQKISFTTDAYPEKFFSGNINYLGLGESGVYLARAFIDNHAYLLKPGMFGKVSIELADLIVQLFVPAKAVQTYGKETFVFEVLGDNQFIKKTITLGTGLKDGYMVESGLENGTSIVTNGSFLLKAELLKNLYSEE